MVGTILFVLCAKQATLQFPFHQLGANFYDVAT